MSRKPSPSTLPLRWPLHAAFAAILAAGTSSVFAANSVKIPLGNKSFGTGTEMTAHSHKQRIDPAKKYHYQVIASCKSTGVLGPLIPARTKLASFMDSIAPEASMSLSGTLKNRSGKLPAVIANHNITSTEDVPGLGKVSISLKLKVKILKSGKVIATISDARIAGQKRDFPGKIKFLPGSRVTLTVVEDGTSNLKTNLSGGQFGNGKPLVVRSGKTKLLEPSALYNYRIDARCTGTGDLFLLLPARTRLGDFLDDIKAGSSRYLSGTYRHRSGQKNAVLVNRRISGNLKTRELGTVGVSLKLNVTVLANGELVAKIQQVRIRSGSKKLPGTIRMSQGAYLSATSAAEIAMKELFTNAMERSGKVRLLVTRTGNLATQASVEFQTSNLSARAGTHYTGTSGTVRFARGQTQAPITIPLTNDDTPSGLPQFKVTLSDPGQSCVLGERKTTVVSIQDED